MTMSTSISNFVALSWVEDLVMLEAHEQDPDTPLTHVHITKHLKVIERKLNTMLELNRGEAVYKKELDELMLGDLTLISTMASCLNDLVDIYKTNNLVIKLYSVYGDAFIKTFI